MGLLDGGAVMPGGEGAVAVPAVQRLWWPVAEFPIAGSVPPLDRLGLGCRLGCLTAQVNLVPCASAPTSLFVALCDGGPPTIERLDVSDQDADQGPS